MRRSLAFAGCTLLSAAFAFAAPPVTHYRSIGSASDYSVGTVTAINGETHVIGSLDTKWQSANRGRGDEIKISGDPYTILSVDAENELTLTEPYSGATAYNQSYVIARKFRKLVEWEDCIEANAACPGVVSASLPSDGRVEVGVVYKDSPFVVNVAGEQLRLDQATTNATYNITLTATPANRHHGVENTGVVIDNTGEGSPAIDISNESGFVTIEWIEIWRGDIADQIFVGNVGDSSRVVVRNVLFHDDDKTAVGLHVNHDQANVLAYNNVFTGLDRGAYVGGLTASSSGTFEFYHNTFFQNTVGLKSSSTFATDNDVIYMNANLAISNGTDFDAPFPNATFSGANWSSDTTATQHYGFPSTPPASVRFVSMSPPYDLHIRRGSIVENNGSPIPAVTNDLDGRPRGGLTDIGADEADSSSANPVVSITAKASYEHVLIEWQHPDHGPMSRVDVVRSEAADPIQPSDGVVACSFATPMPLSKGQCIDTQPLVNGTSYFYSAFVYDEGGNWSKRMSVTGVPFDNLGVPPEWTYQTRGLTLEPPGVRGANAFAVSNDSYFHSMQGSSGATGGEWPLTGWAPYELPAPVQHRPVIVDVGGNNTALLGAQDGRVYAVDITTGKLVWKSEVLGGSIDAAPAALVSAYGATGGGADKVYVGTSDLSSNALFVLDLLTGATIDRFDDAGNPTNVGAVTGVAVKYPLGPVYFTSVNGSGASPRNVWAVDVAVLPSMPSEVWSDNPGPIDAGPTLYKNTVFVGSNGGSLIAYNELGGPALWSQPLGDGPLKAPIFPVWPNDTVIVSTNNSVNSVQFTATGGCGSPPCINWGQSVGAGASPPLLVPGTSFVFAGNGSGVLFELTISLASPTTPPLVRGWGISGSPLGGPAFSRAQMMMYISDTGGVVHGVPFPIP